MYRKIVPFSRTSHGGLRLKPVHGFAHAAALTTAVLCPAELRHAVKEFPMAFVRQPDGVQIIGILGFTAGNEFVGPTGQWLGRYIPAAFRAYPFAQTGDPSGPFLLCLDEESPWFNPTDGEPLVDADGTVTSIIERHAEFLSQVTQNLVLGNRVCGLLDAHGLLKPWTPRVTLPNGSQRDIAGLLQADDTVLGSLPDTAVLELARSGALGIAYVQIHAMSQLTRLEEIARARAQLLQAAGYEAPLQPQRLEDREDDLRNLEFSF